MKKIILIAIALVMPLMAQPKGDTTKREIIDTLDRMLSKRIVITKHYRDMDVSRFIFSSKKEGDVRRTKAAFVSYVGHRIVAFTLIDVERNEKMPTRWSRKVVKMYILHGKLRIKLRGDKPGLKKIVSEKELSDETRKATYKLLLDRLKVVLVEMDKRAKGLTDKNAKLHKWIINM